MNESERGLVFRFDGLDAADHKIELYALGESMQGLARITSVAAHFASTNKYRRYLGGHSFRLLAQEPKANCFTVAVVLEFVKQHQILSGSFGVLLGIIVSWIISKNSNNFNKFEKINSELLLALKDSGTQKDQQISRLFGVLEIIAKDMKGSSRMAVAPIGLTAETLTISSSNGQFKSTYDISDAEKIREKGVNELTGVEVVAIRLSELDTERKTAKIYIEEIHEPIRVGADISDPLMDYENNPYALALASQRFIRVRAKLKYTDGVLSRAYISDVEP